MSQAIVKDLRRDLTALAKRQETFEDKLLTNTLSKEDAEFFRSMALHYADEAKKVRAKMLEMIADAGDQPDVTGSEAPIS